MTDQPNPTTGVGSAAFSHEQGDRIPGYRKLTEPALDAITVLKQGEERALRYLDHLAATEGLDMRWLALARTHLQMGTMFAIRAIAQPTRIKLPEDGRYEVREVI